MIMRCLAFTFFAKVKIWADNTFIANSYNIMGVAFITSDSGVYNFRKNFLFKGPILNNFLRFSLFLNFFRYFDLTLCNNFFLYFRNNIGHHFCEFLIDGLIDAFN